MFPEPRGILRVSGEQNSLFPVGPVIKCFVIHPNSKIVVELTIIFLTLAGKQICRSFKVHDLIRCESKIQVVVSLDREVVSFVRHREFVSFDPWHVTLSPPIGKRT